jgi:AraC family transcriptional regulator of adaptative response/methylated-DNA-[protein]-cysteine methyltransferase
MRKIRVEFFCTAYYITSMKSYDLNQQADDYHRIEQAIHVMDARFLEHPDLNQLAAAVHLSKFHFIRIFKRWAGITPLQFIRYLTVEYAKKKLKESRTILNTAFSAGLSGGGRLHDLFITFEGMTPGEYKNCGKDLRIEYGFHQTPFGTCLIAVTKNGICHLSFIKQGEQAINFLRKSWPKSFIEENPSATGPLIEQIFLNRSGYRNRPFNLLLKGTNFQISVWKALLDIPPGILLSYGDVARLCGMKTATRAVAQAIAHNPVAYLIPCHRVISGAGKFHGYRWGIERKKALIAREANL